MKLDLSQADIEWHTLEFLSLRYSRRIGSNLNDLSGRKLTDDIYKQMYDKIEQELPFEAFKRKIYET
jgi:hypothetical protein